MTIAIGRFGTAVKTAVFKLHNPSRRKRAMLDYALRQNHLAYSRALAAVVPHLPALLKQEIEARSGDEAHSPAERRKNARLRQFERERLVGAIVTKTIKPMPICGAAKAARSIPGAVIAQVESYIELHQHQEFVGVPTAQRLKRDQRPYEAALMRLAGSTNVDEENQARDALLLEAKAGKYRPMLFAVNRKNDGFLLLADPANGRLYAFLNLVPSESRFAKLTEFEQRERSSRRIDGLVNQRTGEIVRFTSTTGCLFPLEFGRDFQSVEFLQKGSPLSAKLIKTDDRYELHVTFEFEPERIEPRHVLGVDRGIYNLASMTVADTNGGVVDRKNVDGRTLRFVQRKLERVQRKAQQRGRRHGGRTRRHFADEAVHKTANEIVDMATRHRAQVILENLSGLADRSRKRKRSNFNRLLNRSQYQKLQRVLGYKLAIAGLPRPLTVHPAYTSQACPECGLIDRANRAKRPIADGFAVQAFACVGCGYADDADLNASRMIALKRIWRDSLSPALRSKTMSEIPADKSFETFLRIRAARRGERSCAREGGTSGSAGLDGQYEDGEVPPGANAVEPRSGSNTPAGHYTPTAQSAVSPSDENPHSPVIKMQGVPDG